MKRAASLSSLTGMMSKFFFCWTLPLFWTGLKRDLATDDLGPPLKTDISDNLANKLEKNWFNQVYHKETLKRKPSLLKALTKTFIWQYLLDGVLILIQYVCCKSFQPLLLAMLLSYFSGQCTKQQALCYAGGLVGLSLANVFIQHHTTLRQQQLGMRVRIACCSLIYRKILRLNTFSLSQTTAGQVINLMSNDVNRFDSVLKFLHILWVVPIQIALCCYLYYHRVSSVALLGVVSILLQTIPVQTFVSKASAKLRLKIAQKTDERVRLIDEIICGIQVIKMYAWEVPFEACVKSIRKRELVSVSQAAFLRAITASFIIFAERTSLYIVLLVHVFLQYPIDAPTVYALAQFYNMLQTMLAYVYPNAVSASVECLVSIERIQAFLLLDERHVNPICDNSSTFGPPSKFLGPLCESKVTSLGPTKHHMESEPAVEICEAGASWDGGMQQHLNDVNLKISSGKLCVVIGPVGAGKSSLLQLILRELPHNAGQVKVRGEVSYAGQEPWLFVSTIRNNIIFGQPYDPKKYRNVVHVCALEQDFQQFPRGDQTLVGERGVSLSGGQRARINLARAVYRQGDIYLLDDPLSGVDTPVGSHLFHACIKNYLKGKTRILVTHQQRYLKSADIILVMNNGRIEKTGTLEELKKGGEDFKGLLEVNSPLPESGEDATNFSPTKSIRDISRRISIASTGMSEYEETEPQAEEEQAEHQVSGRMQASVFWRYWKAGGKPYLLIAMVLTVLMSQLLASTTDYWVTFWTNQHNQEQQMLMRQIFLTAPDGNMETALGFLNFERFGRGNHSHLSSYYKRHNMTRPFNMRNFTKSRNRTLTEELHRHIGPLTTLQYVYVYSTLIGFCVIMAITGSSLFFRACVKSSQGLHKLVFSKIIRAKMRFFDSNPSGRILNRFSKDIGVIDEMMPRDMMEALQITMFITSALVMVSITNSWLLIPTCLVLGLFYLLIYLYLGTAQDIKRLEGITRSPVFSHTCATIKGIATIRSSNAQEKVAKEFDSRQDVHTAAWYQFLASRSTLGFWLDITCVMFVACVTNTFIFFNNESTLSGHVGLAISQSLILTSTLQFGVRQMTEVVAHLTSVERVLQYVTVDGEQGLDRGEKTTPKDWPSEGSVSFKHVSLSYNDTDTPVLEDLNVVIEKGWKVGIVGRTGAGKSSLISALFRLAKVEGYIHIDGLEMGTIALQDLRSHISIIPQEPILFSSTMRYNLDPLGKYDDASLWKALETVDLKESVPSLDFQVSEGGSNFSMGQKQLVCLARAIIRNNKILVLDEATASMDAQTDHFIQKIIRENFSSCTVLTIAHRLNTVMDADRVLVMEKGKVAEYDSPQRLLQKQDSIFRQMVKESGIL